MLKIATAAPSRGENLWVLKVSDVPMVDRRDLLGLKVTKCGLLDNLSSVLIVWRENQGRITALGKGQFLQHDHFASSAPLALLVITISDL